MMLPQPEPSVSTPRRETSIPRWLELQLEIDYLMWQLGVIQKALGKRSGLDIAIDDATGHGQAMLDNALEIVEQLKPLRAEYDALVGHS
jgi:hypothetical protein